ncbi:MAG: acyltransferase [Marinobacter sp.]|jgi:peptidoglycan/LPS O-acetylase OafA/YrhL|nr:acyltransferase [Marinobacter sp.]
MKRLELLDYGRFFAAISVVLFHYTFNGIANGKITSISHTPWLIGVTKYGYLGVEFFFMISGFVIFFSARNKVASRFIVSRAIRIYPAYWFAVLFTSFFAMQWGANLMSIYPSQVLANLTMLQSLLGITHIDGVYWTLVYEIQFYFTVFLLIFFGLQKYLNYIFIFWPIIFFAALAFEIQDLPLMGSYFYYFSAGAIFAVLKEKFDWRAVFSLFLIYILCLNFSISNVEQSADSKEVEYSFMVIGLIVTFFFLLFGYQNTQKAQLLKLPLSKIAGALTYPVYLIHAHFGYMFISQFATEENKVFVYILTISIVLAVSLLIHKVVEEYFAAVWKGVFGFVLSRPLDYVQALSARICSAYSAHKFGRF